VQKKLLIALLGITSVTMGLTGCGFGGDALTKTSTSGIQSPVRLNPNEFRADGVSKKQVLVSFKTRSTDLSAFERRNGVKVKRSLASIGSAIVTISGDPETFVSKLRRDAAVAYAELDRALLMDDVKVNDPSRGQQYALDTVNANTAWESTMGSDKVTIAIVDSGLDLEHPDLKGKLVAGYNAVAPGEAPKDDVGHGTHVAGIAAASTNNGLGIAGLAANSKLMPVKVLGDGTGSAASVSDGIIWAADHGADVINMSLGFYDENETLGKAVAYALSKNVVVVATMGNNNIERKRFPAAFPGVIAVGSTAKGDTRSTFSNFGDWMSVSAPGTDILSTFPRYPVSINGSQSGYASLSGTSMAAPLVAGLCGLVRSQHPGMAPAEVKKLLETSAADLGDKGYDKYFGNGRIDAFQAVSK
jgi:subtilisin family serine protease